MRDLPKFNLIFKENKYNLKLIWIKQN
jgi:hypothetical protein